MSTKRAQFLEYEGSNYLRQRLVLATLTGRAIRINKIRCESCEYEYQLIQKLYFVLVID